ncbi:MAG: hypothetical protein HOK30_27315 [Rhodospirillaceae bacterium]|jgi:hypothetical protein|nr:hypothetical protein [Rhodospirillaceae bacterium]MBT6431404.1 hypothetical protein [Rhodospirillaceae bacterium]MBT7758454.1 hypothetical protein [Rhodospirillaceae bacterium]
MAETEDPKKRPDIARVYPESENWTPPGELDQDLKIDHPVYRKAKSISIGIGAIAGFGVAIGHTEAPWWMPFLVFAVTAAIVYRILRPRFRHPSIEDEI